jgi:ABC-type sugar transport system permease subunit
LAGLTIVNYLFGAGFEQGNLGYASAVGWVLVLIIASVGLLQLFLARSKEARR